MDLRRLWHTIRLITIRSGPGRADYIRKQNVFASMGKECDYMPRIIPLYPNLIKIGNHVNIASHVQFHTHDTVHSAIGIDNDYIADKVKGYSFPESIGCIEIGDHVFIGANSCIEYNVRIGSNVVITAGSVVTSDIPSNSVARGNPAKVICTLEQYIKLRAAKDKSKSHGEYAHQTGAYINKELEKHLWKEFYEER